MHPLASAKAFFSMMVPIFPVVFLEFSGVVSYSFVWVMIPRQLWLPHSLPARYSSACFSLCYFFLEFPFRVLMRLLFRLGEFPPFDALCAPFFPPSTVDFSLSQDSFFLLAVFDDFEL